MRRFLALTLIAAALAGCGDPKIDSSSKEAFQASIAKVAKDLPEDQKAKLKADVMLLAFQGMDLGQVLQGKKTTDDASGDMMAALNGLTAKELSIKADQVRKERAEKERQQALSEIAELAKKKELSEAAAVLLKKFEVQQSRFYKQKQQYGLRDQPVIELVVANGTGVAVSQASFRGTISSPGRSVPWLVEEFSYAISGGIETGEGQHWKLAPNQFSDWGTVNPPQDALFTVEVTRLDGADGKPLFGGGAFTEHDAARLESLRMKYLN
ncbi:DUF6694 family lipoprotein [Pseudomonas entomophila]|uniref:DUF6694 family lipoprotein n=1 Tax=Pseudomonas entomophila TaxID=312306 RepID=UPI001EFF8019|nr:DUF6694 family lipoprotein [Pseudomonas entomophila]MCG8291994.1 hypothetical protein [Pseudomonas entomophila]